MYNDHRLSFLSNLGLRLDENWVFGVKNRTSRQKTVITRHGELQRDREQSLLAIRSPRRTTTGQGAVFARHGE